MRAKAQQTHGAVGPFLFRKGKVALVPRTSVHLYVTGDPCDLILNETDFSFPPRQQEGWTQFRAGTGGPAVSLRYCVPSAFLLVTLCDDKGATRAPPLH